MADENDIVQYQQLLAAHRRTLAHYLKQREDLGVIAPPAIAHGIAEARGEIERIKAALRDWGAVVVDEANDEEPLPPLSPPVELPDLFPMANNLIGQQEHFDHVCELFDGMTQQGHGHFVFLTGQPGYGRVALAHALAEELRRSGVGVLLMRFWPMSRLSEEDQEVLWTDDPLLDPAVAALEPQLAQAWPRAVRIAGWAWVRLAAQVGYLLERVPTPQGEHLEDDPTAIKGLLRRAARHQPLLLVLERLEHAPDLWIDLLRDLAPEIERDLPLLVLVTLEVSRRLEELPTEQYSEAMHLAHTLNREGRGDVLWLGPVTVGDVAVYIDPAEGRLARRLHELAAGVPAIVESLWDAWERDRVVEQDEDGTWRVVDDTQGWVTGDLRDPVLRLLAARLDSAAPFDRRQAEEILSCAALEGPTFTAQAVVRALNLDNDVLLDFLDDYLLDEEARPGLVAEVGFLPIPAAPVARYPNLYRFAYPYLWHLWARYGLPEGHKADYQWRLAEALEQVYYPATDMVAERLIALFEGAGSSKRAEPYRRRIQSTADIVVLRWQTELLERTAADDFDRYRLFELRLELSEKLYQAGQYQEGYVQAEAALRLAKAWRHPIREARACNLVGVNLEQLGCYAEAREHLERALTIREQAFGPQHPSTARSLNNLALLLRAQGEYKAARSLMERALRVTEQAFGPQHPNTAGGLNNLALLLQAQGEYEAARPLYERALAIAEQALGPQHPNTARGLNNLAGLLKSQGEYEVARPLYERALRVTEQVFGPQHPNTARSLNDLALLLQAQGEYEAARPLMERALAIREQALGPQHPNTAGSLNNLAGLLESQGEYEAARPLYERALRVTEQALGPQHTDTARSLNNLAMLYAYAGRFEEAIPLMQRALAICEAVLGSQHPHTQSSRESLAAMEEAAQRVQGATPQTREEQIAEIMRQVEAAVASALAEGDAAVRAALAEQLERVAQQAEAAQEAGSPYLALAAHLRELAAHLRKHSRSSAPSDMDAQDGSAG